MAPARSRPSHGRAASGTGGRLWTARVRAGAIYGPLSPRAVPSHYRFGGAHAGTAAPAPALASSRRSGGSEPRARTGERVAQPPPAFARPAPFGAAHPLPRRPAPRSHSAYG